MSAKTKKRDNLVHKGGTLTMSFFGAAHFKTGKMSKCAISSGMSLLIIASVLSAPATILISPVISFAAPARPAPFGTDIANNVNKTAALSDNDITTLQVLSKGSLLLLNSLIDRINAILVRLKSRYRLNVPVAKPNRVRGAKFIARVDVLDFQDGREVVGSFSIGTVVNDDPEVIS